jgi:hypothetical protein
MVMKTPYTEIRKVYQSENGISHENYDNYYANDRKDKELRKLIPACRACFKELTDKCEPITIKPWSCPDI